MRETRQSGSEGGVAFGSLLPLSPLRGEDDVSGCCRLKPAFQQLHSAKAAPALGGLRR
jgi:hypothetical protein